MLEQGYYVFGLNNEKYIPIKKAYKQYDHVHDYILLGYDNEKNVFQSAGYIETGKYEYFDIPYDAFLDSLKYFCFERMAIYFRRIPSTYSAGIDIASIMHKITSYLQVNKHESGKHLHGIAVWMQYVNELIKDTKNDIDIRFARCFAEHKDIMLHRLNLLYEKGYLTDSSLLHEYEKFVQVPGSTSFLLSIKYNMTKRKEERIKVADMITCANKHEQRILDCAVRSFAIQA